MKWYEVTVSTTSECAELVADIMQSAGGNGAAISDPADADILQHEELYWDYVDEQVLAQHDGSEVFVKGFVLADCAEEKLSELKDKLEELRQRAEGNLPCGTLSISSRQIDDSDWTDVWKKHYRHIKIGSVVICPDWLEQQAGEGEVTVRLDPGTAFGTGEHETTAMCIELLQRCKVKDAFVVDAGCGSGILGITASKLGAATVSMTDIDPVAVRAAELNAQKNELKDNVKISRGSLLEGIDRPADILLCNIMADVLIDNAHELTKGMLSGGSIILSGIIRSRLEDVMRAFSHLEFAEKLERGEWCALLFHKAGKSHA